MNKWLKIIQKKLSECLSFPQNCILCLHGSERNFALCTDCEDNLPWIKHGCYQCALPLLIPSERFCGSCLQEAPSFIRCQSLFNYEWPVKNFILKLKYQGQFHFAKILGSLMAESLIPVYEPDCIVPMPLHPLRQKERGFNQCIELSKIISKQKGWPLEAKSCSRHKNTQSQMGLNARKRANNIKAHHFTVQKGFAPSHVLVIEDVVTTKATVHAFAKALKKAGVQTVEIWSCARAPLSF